MSKTYVIAATSGGAATVSNQLDGTPVAFAGKTGRVRAAIASTLTTTRVTLRGASGQEIIPASCAPNVVGPITAQVLNAEAFIFDGFVKPNEQLFLEIVKAGAETYMIAVRVD